MKIKLLKITDWIIMILGIILLLATLFSNEFAVLQKVLWSTIDFSLAFNSFTNIVTKRYYK